MSSLLSTSLGRLESVPRSPAVPVRYGAAGHVQCPPQVQGPAVREAHGGGRDIKGFESLILRHTKGCLPRSTPLLRFIRENFLDQHFVIVFAREADHQQEAFSG